MKLAEAIPSRRLFFALWCLDALWSRGGAYLLGTRTAAQSTDLQRAREQLWLQALDGADAKVSEIVEAALQDFDVHEDDFSGAPHCASSIADLLTAASKQDNPTNTAIDAGLCVINQIYFFLQEQTIEDYDYDTSPAVTAEFKRQLVMIDTLRSNIRVSTIKTIRAPSAFTRDKLVHS